MTLTGIPVVDVLVIVAVGLTAVGVIWRQFLRPIIRAAQKVNETLPTLMTIAEEFTPNGGSSLHDIISKMAADAEVLGTYAHSAKHETVNRLAVLQGDQVLQGERLDGFIEETKTRFEELGAEVTSVKSDVGHVMTIIDRRGEPR